MNGQNLTVLTSHDVSGILNSKVQTDNGSIPWEHSHSELLFTNSEKPLKMAFQGLMGKSL